MLVPLAGRQAEWADRLWSATRGQLSRLPSSSSWTTLASAAKHAVRYLSAHTGIPALLVAAVLVALGYRALRWTLRFALEVALLAAALGLMTAAGWIQW